MLALNRWMTLISNGSPCETTQVRLAPPQVIIFTDDYIPDHRKYEVGTRELESRSRNVRTGTETAFSKLRSSFKGCDRKVAAKSNADLHGGIGGNGTLFAHFQGLAARTDAYFAGRHRGGGGRSGQMLLSYIRPV